MANQIEKDASKTYETNQEIFSAAAKDTIAIMMNSTLDSVNNKSNNHSEIKFEENVEYVEPIQDPYNKAIKYLENHNVLQLFQQLTASIIYTKPDKPLEYMIQEVERMKKEKEQERTKK